MDFSLMGGHQMRYGMLVVCGLACTSVPGSVSAVTLIEQADGESTTLMYVDGAKLRTEDGGGEGYGLMDLEKRTMYLVNPREGTAFDMSSTMWKATASADSNAVPVDAKLEKMGSGPEIAGYATEHYALFANGSKCQDLYLSRKAFDDSGFAEQWDSISTAWQEMDLDRNDACDAAEVEALDYRKHGWPLRTVHRDSMHEGQFEETIRIEQGAAMPPGGFALPTGYTVVSFQEMMGSLQGQNMGGAADWTDDDADDEYGDDGYDEEFDDEYDHDPFDDEEQADEEAQEAAEDLGDRLKGFMGQFKNDGQ
jgi:hypothetical protein